jgi:hypothetical protein
MKINTNLNQGLRVGSSVKHIHRKDLGIGIIVSKNNTRLCDVRFDGIEMYGISINKLARPIEVDVLNFMEKIKRDMVIECFPLKNPRSVDCSLNIDLWTRLDPLHELARNYYLVVMVSFSQLQEASAIANPASECFNIEISQFEFNSFYSATVFAGIMAKLYKKVILRRAELGGIWFVKYSELTQIIDASLNVSLETCIEPLYKMIRNYNQEIIKSYSQLEKAIDIANPASKCFDKEISEYEFNSYCLADTFARIMAKLYREAILSRSQNHGMWTVKYTEAVEVVTEAIEVVNEYEDDYEEDHFDYEEDCDPRLFIAQCCYEEEEPITNENYIDAEKRYWEEYDRDIEDNEIWRFENPEDYEYFREMPCGEQY